MKQILVVDDHEVVQEEIKRIFDVQPKTVCVSGASTDSEAIGLVEKNGYDLVVLDISLGDRSVREDLKRIIVAIDPSGAAARDRNLVATNGGRKRR